MPGYVIIQNGRLGNSYVAPISQKRVFLPHFLNGLGSVSLNSSEEQRGQLSGWPLITPPRQKIYLLNSPRIVSDACVVQRLRPWSPVLTSLYGRPVCVLLVRISSWAFFFPSSFLFFLLFWGVIKFNSNVSILLQVFFLVWCTF